MRRLFYLFAIVAISVFTLVGCGNNNDIRYDIRYRWKFELELLKDGGMYADDKEAFENYLAVVKEDHTFTIATEEEAEEIFNELIATLTAKFEASLANVVRSSTIKIKVSCVSSALAKQFVDIINIPDPFDIEFSTGEAVWDELNPSSAQSTLVLNKLGVGNTGTVPYLEVRSSSYWTVKVSYSNKGAEGFEPWLEVSPLGGPQPGLSVTNVYLTMGENKGEDRSAVLIFTTLAKTYQVNVKQRGPLSY